MASEENSSKETIPAENSAVETLNNGEEEQEEDLQGAEIMICLNISIMKHEYISLALIMLMY